MNERKNTRLHALLRQHELHMGKPLAACLECDIKTAYRRIEDTDRLTVRELKLLHRRGGVPAAEIAAAIFWDGDADRKSERPEGGASKRSCQPCGIVAGQRPLTSLCYHNARRMSRKTTAGEAVDGK